MPHRKYLQSHVRENPEHLLTIWRQERAFRVGKTLAYFGLAFSLIATVADFYWSDVFVFTTDVILLLGCSVSFYWVRASHRPQYFWLPIYWSFWISILPSLWVTGGLNSPFFAADLAALYIIGAVMETKNRAPFYMAFALVHIPAFYFLEFFHKMSLEGSPPLMLTAVITGVTLGAVFVCVHAVLRTEKELSFEFSVHYNSLVKAKEELKKREGQLREAQSIAQIGSWEWDIEADKISWSEELFKIFEISKENFDPSFKAYLQRLRPEMRERINSIIQESLRTGNDFYFENKISTKSGEKFILSRGRVIKDEKNRIIKMLGTSQDITDRKRIEAELTQARNEMEKRVEERTLQLAQSLEREKAAKEMAESANQAKMQFLANMSHEIRTPMNAILGFSELLASEENSKVDSDEYLARIRANGSQLLHLIDDILDLSKFEAGQIPIHKGIVSVKSVIDEVVSSFLPALKSKEIELQLSYQNDNWPQIYTDAHRLSQVITNLLSNAIKFCSKGKIQIGVSREILESGRKMNLIVDIEDTGIGISPDHQKKLFQPFSQGDSSIVRKYGGSGLGLALSKRIAEALGGSLELKKSIPERGSHFCFIVPAEIVMDHQEQVVPSLNAISEVSLERPLFGKSILLAEDSPDNALLVCHYIKSTGARVDVVTDGIQAVNAVEKKSYDCILMDIQMPKMDGLEATRKIRTLGFKNPIIALTAHALPAETARSLEAGCDLHLTKPIHKAELVRTLIAQLKKAA